MKKLIANKPFVYDGKSLKAEEPFEAHEFYVNVLLAYNLARTAKRKYQRRDMVAEDTLDMTAEAE